MKFDIDCARDILLTVEACKLNDVMYIKDLENELFQYDPDEISYMCLKLYEADFINATCKKSASVINIVRINDITYEGHQFLANIREDSMWEKVKHIASSAGTLSIPIVQKIAIECIKATLLSKFNIQI